MACSNCDQVNLIIGYLQFFIGIIGVTGNVLAIIIFSRPSLRRFSYSFYCLAMAISDIGFLLHTFKEWAVTTFKADFATIGKHFCALSMFVPFYFGGVSTFLLTIISIDRMLTIVYPNRFIVLKKRWVQAVIVIIVALISLLVGIITPISYEVKVLNQTNSSIQTRVCTAPSNIIMIVAWITLGMFISLNIITNNVVSFKTIRFIMASRQRVGVIGARNRSSSLSKRDQKFSICSVCLDIVSIISKLPFLVTILTIYSLKISNDVTNLVFKITNTLSYMDNGFSFFINMYVNSLFYEEFLILFGFKKSRSESNNTTTNSSLNNINNNKKSQNRNKK